MARHVEFGNHADAAVARVLDQVVDFVLRVVKTVGTQFMELREFFALDAKALIFGEVPVEDVHFHGFEAVDVSFEHIERNEMARGIDHQSAPGKARLIVDCDGGTANPSGETSTSCRKVCSPCKVPSGVGAVSLAPEAVTSST